MSENENIQETTTQVPGTVPPPPPISGEGQTANGSGTNGTQPTETAEASIIAQLQAQNAALIEQNNALNQQVIRMVQSGAQFNQTQQPSDQTQQPTQQAPAHVTQAQQLENLGMQFEAPKSYETPSLSKVGEMTLESLAGEIGKDRPTH